MPAASVAAVGLRVNHLLHAASLPGHDAFAACIGEVISLSGEGGIALGLGSRR